MTTPRTKSQLSRLSARLSGSLRARAMLGRTLGRTLGPALGTVGLATLAFAGCDPSVFVDLGNQAPVVAFERPTGFKRTGFGATVASMEGLLRNGEPATRLAVGGGPDTGVWIYDIWNADDVGTFGISNTACETPATDCVTGTGSALAGFPAFGAEGTCLAIGEAASDQVRVKCETVPSMAFSSSTGSQSGLEFGFAVAAVPEASTADSRAVLLVGAPAANADTGTLFRIPPTGGGAVELGEVAATSGVVRPGARLGETIATASLPDELTFATSFPNVPAPSVLTPFLAAVSAPGQHRVIIVAVGVDPLDGTDIDAQVLACLDGADGFGGALVAGDVDGDGMPEIYIGHAEGTMNHPGVVTVFNLADLTTLEGGCAEPSDADDPVVTTLSCPTLEGVDCTEGAFGSALALGDVDADGVLDLIAGAPRMTVQTRLGAGGVFAIGGSATGLNTASVSFMQLASPGTNDRLGASLAALRTHYGIPGVTPRHEVAAGAPGANTAFIFLCSGLGGDSSDTGNRCLELAPE